MIRAGSARNWATIWATLLLVVSITTDCTRSGENSAADTPVCGYLSLMALAGLAINAVWE
jgi:hypothetical protein